MDQHAALFDKIAANKPKLVYISGKACTGKTTLAKSLQDTFGAAIIELDEIVRKIDTPNGTNRFEEIYKGAAETPTIQKFTDQTTKELFTALATHPMVVFEGAIANSQTLSAITQAWSKDFLFIYLHPVHLDAYANQLTERLMQSSANSDAGLPRSFWSLLSNEERKTFHSAKLLTDEIKTAIATYAKQSAHNSVSRLALFAKDFNDIIVVKV